MRKLLTLASDVDARFNIYLSRQNAVVSVVLKDGRQCNLDVSLLIC